MTCARHFVSSPCTFADFVTCCGPVWQGEDLDYYLELLVERVGADDDEVDMQMDHTFTLCKYIANNHQKVRPVSLTVCS